MLFNRYREVTNRCLELGGKMESLSNEEAAELRRLLEEQAWLSKTISRQTKGALEGVRQSLGRIEQWVNEALVQVEKALDNRGIPSDVLALEDIMEKAVSLKDKARSLAWDDGIEEGKTALGEPVNNGGEYPYAADIRIDMSEKKDDQEKKSIEEINAWGREVAVTSPEINLPANNITLESTPVGSKDRKQVNEWDNRRFNKWQSRNNKEKSLGSDSEKHVAKEEAQQGADRHLSSCKLKWSAVQSPGPMTYKLSQDVVASLERKLSPELLPKSAGTEGNTIEMKKSDIKKERKKTKKKKK